MWFRWISILSNIITVKLEKVRCMIDFFELICYKMTDNIHEHRKKYLTYNIFDAIINLAIAKQIK